MVKLHFEVAMENLANLIDNFKIQKGRRIESGENRDGAESGPRPRPLPLVQAFWEPKLKHRSCRVSVRIGLRPCTSSMASSAPEKHYANGLHDFLLSRRH